MPDNIFGRIQRVERDRRRHEDNAARTASQYVTYETAGVGDLIPEDDKGEPLVIGFALPFFSEPSVVHGVAMVRNPELDYFYMPQATGGVYEWERNERGFYIGFMPYFRVEVARRPGTSSGDGPLVADPVMYHHFVFTGPSYKVMSEEVNQAALVDEALLPYAPPV